MKTANGSASYLLISIKGEIKMKMSEFVNNVLDKEMLIDILSHSSCEVCPFKMACQDASMDNSEETCEQFLNRWIEDDRNEG